jgi:two-component system cell cycle response regulator
MTTTIAEVKGEAQAMAGKILIVDSVATNRIVLKVKLTGACYETIQGATGETALRLARSERPDLILLDVQLPDINGIDVCRRLRADPLLRTIPVVMLGSSSDATTRIAALKAGADDFLAKPIDELLLLARLRSLLRARETDEELRLRESTCRALGFGESVTGFEPPARVALISSSRERAAGWRRALVPHLANVELAVMSRDEALAEAGGQAAPDGFIIDSNLSRAGDGLRLMSELRSRQASRHATVCIALEGALREAAAVALDLGASDLLPANLSRVEDAQEAALRLGAQLRRKAVADRQRSSVADGLRLAVTDPLTGLYNRRYALPHLARIADRARETGRQFAVMVLDLDRFKAVNDTWGHAAGDAVLVEIAARLTANLRDVDMVARIGGEEFLVAMPETTLEAARIAAERLCRLVEQDPVRLGDGITRISVTVSIGLAMGGGAALAPGVEALMGEADRALLGSKAFGRNKVTVSATAA